MTIAELVTLAKQIHDAEGIDLGARSTREQRNAFWLRVIGIVHFGHVSYNPVPDPRWHVKDAGGGRPMSDDVAVLLPSRDAWDCIPGAGADGYRFEVDHVGVLPPEQTVYQPTRPAGSGIVVPPAGAQDGLVGVPRYELRDCFSVLNREYQRRGRPNRCPTAEPRDALFIDNEGIYVWLPEFIRYRQIGKTLDEAIAAVLADIAAVWR